MLAPTRSPTEQIHSELAYNSNHGIHRRNHWDEFADIASRATGPTESNRTDNKQHIVQG